MATKRSGKRDKSPEEPANTRRGAPPLPEALVREFEELGLSPYEARVVLALLRLGSANSVELARLSGVPRTSIYQLIDGLTAKGLAARVPGEGPAVWTSPGRDELLDRLHSAQEERLRQHRARTARVREALIEAFPDTDEAALPYIHLLHGTAQLNRSYEQLWADVAEEVLAFSRPPYAQIRGNPLTPVLQALERGVSVRAIYETATIADPHSGAFRDEIEAYIEAGVDARVADLLPMKLVVFDRRSTLVALTGPVVEVGYPSNLLIEHEGFAEVQADAFERRWEKALRYSPLPVGQGRRAEEEVS